MKQNSTPPQKPSKFNYYLPVALLSIFGFFVPPVMLKSWELHVVIISIIFTVAAGGGFWLFRILQRHLGFLTAGAAMALLAMGSLMALLATQPTCPGSLTASRCSPSEIAAWGITGLMATGTYIMLLAIPSWMYKGLKKSLAAAYKFIIHGFKKLQR